MLSPALRGSVPALLLSLLVVAPFLGKAFTIDDTVFMAEARHALVDPLHPLSFDMVWQEVPERVSKIVPTGPVIAWLLAPAALAGDAEWAAHAMQLVMLWIAIVSTVALALRLGLAQRWAMAAGLLLAAMPAVLAMADTAMPDVPAMALGVCGIERLVAWNQERRLTQAVLSSLLLGLAALTRTHAIMLVGVGAILVGPALTSRTQTRGLTTLVPLVAAPLVTLAISAIAGDAESGAGAIVGPLARYSSISVSRVSSNAVAFFIHWGLAMVFALPWAVLRGRSFFRLRGGLLSGILGTGLAAAALARADRPVFPLALVAGLGLAAIWDAILIGWATRDRAQLALGCWLLIPLLAIPYVHLPPKYLVLSAPAAALLVTRALERASEARARVVLGAAVLLGASLGVAILRADAAIGDLSRRVATELITPRVAAGRHVWFVGHWGFQHYAERAGARHVTLTPPYPERGDFLVVSLASARSDRVLDDIARRYPGIMQVSLLQDITPGGRIMNKRLNAGFYSNKSGYWPWVWGDGPIDVFLAFDL
jgi:hypothetical protein